MPADQIPLRQAWYADQLLREYRTGYPYASEEAHHPETVSFLLAYKPPAEQTISQG